MNPSLSIWQRRRLRSNIISRKVLVDLKGPATMSAPKVSVLLPVYNVESYLQECLDSVCRQTLKDIEIICINDGSTDGSLTILNKYANEDDRIIILDGPNGGYGRAMNRGLERASGEYIGIVEPDDYIALTMYEDLYRLASCNNLDLVKADFYRFKRSDNGNMRFIYNHLDQSGEWYGKVFSPSESLETMLFIMNTWSGIYRRSFLNQYEIRHNETPGASFQDNGFWFQTFAYADRAMIVDKPYYRNRRDNPNSSVRDPGKVYAMNVEYDFIEGKMKDSPRLWEKFKPIVWRKRFGNYFATLSRIDLSCVSEYMNSFYMDLMRAKHEDGLVEAFYTESMWNKINQIADDPAAFCRHYIKERKKKESPSIWRRGVRKVARAMREI